MNYDNKVTGMVIKNLRQEKGITQEVVSGLANIPRSHLAMIENGQISPKVDTLWRIAEALKMPLSDIILLVENSLCKHNHAIRILN